MESTQTVERGLVRQGTVTILMGETPVASLPGAGDGVGDIINFLRTGCPAVQLSYEGSSVNAEQTLQDLKFWLGAYQEGETFEVIMHEHRRGEHYCLFIFRVTRTTVR